MNPLHNQPFSHACAVALALSLALPPAAARPAAATQTPPPRTATERLLEMQRQSSGPPRPIPGDQAQASYRRYLDSFTRKIPESSGTGLDKTQGAEQK